jgi:hypothetical protein
MLEDSTSRNGLVAFALDFVSFAKAYPVTTLIWVGSIPFWAYSWVTSSPVGVLPLFPLHAYFMTAIFLVENYLRGGKANLFKKWFWAAMSCSLPVHGAVLIGLYYWDHADPGRDTLLYSSFASRLLLASGLELVVLDGIFSRFRSSVKSSTVYEKISDL